MVGFDSNGKAISILEKPTQPKFNYAVTCLYFYDNDVVHVAANANPSERGEIEISDINQAYLERGDLDVQVMGRVFAWLDTGTHDSLLEVSSFIATIQKQQNTRSFRS